MTTALAKNPIDRLLTEHDDTITRRRADLTKQMARAEAAKVAIWQTLFNRWGSDSTHRDRDTEAAYHVAKLAAHDEQAPYVRRIEELRIELEALPRQYEVGRRAIAENTAVGPEIAVPPLPTFPNVEHDEPCITLQAERDRLVAAVQDLERDVPVFDRLIGLAREAVEAAVARQRLGLSADVAGAEAALRETEVGRVRNVEQQAELTAGIATIDEQLDDRRLNVTRNRRDAIVRELTTAMGEAADDVVRAMGSSTKLRRVLAALDSLDEVVVEARGVWALSALNADEPRSNGREFLQVALERGWRPSKGTRKG